MGYHFAMEPIFCAIYEMWHSLGEIFEFEEVDSTMERKEEKYPSQQQDLSLLLEYTEKDETCKLLNLLRFSFPDGMNLSLKTRCVFVLLVLSSRHGMTQADNSFHIDTVVPEDPGGCHGNSKKSDQTVTLYCHYHYPEMTLFTRYCDVYLLKTWLWFNLKLNSLLLKENIEFGLLIVCKDKTHYAIGVIISNRTNQNLNHNYDQIAYTHAIFKQTVIKYSSHGEQLNITEFEVCHKIMNSMSESDQTVCLCLGYKVPVLGVFINYQDVCKFKSGFFYTMTKKTLLQEEKFVLIILHCAIPTSLSNSMNRDLNRYYDQMAFNLSVFTFGHEMMNLQSFINLQNCIILIMNVRWNQQRNKIPTKNWCSNAEPEIHCNSSIKLKLDTVFFNIQDVSATTSQKEDVDHSFKEINSLKGNYYFVKHSNFYCTNVESGELWIAYKGLILLIIIAWSHRTVIRKHVKELISTLGNYLQPKGQTLHVYPLHPEKNNERPEKNEQRSGTGTGQQNGQRTGDNADIRQRTNTESRQDNEQTTTDDSSQLVEASQNDTDQSEGTSVVNFASEFVDKMTKSYEELLVTVDVQYHIQENQMLEYTRESYKRFCILRPVIRHIATQLAKVEIMANKTFPIEQIRENFMRICKHVIRLIILTTAIETVGNEREQLLARLREVMGHLNLAIHQLRMLKISEILELQPLSLEEGYFRELSYALPPCLGRILHDVWLHSDYPRHLFTSIDYFDTKSQQTSENRKLPENEGEGHGGGESACPTNENMVVLGAHGGCEVNEYQSLHMHVVMSQVDGEAELPERSMEGSSRRSTVMGEYHSKNENDLEIDGETDRESCPSLGAQISEVSDPSQHVYDDSDIEVDGGADLPERPKEESSRRDTYHSKIDNDLDIDGDSDSESCPSAEAQGIDEIRTICTENIQHEHERVNESPAMLEPERENIQDEQENGASHHSGQEEHEEGACNSVGSSNEQETPKLVQESREIGFPTDASDGGATACGPMPDRDQQFVNPINSEETFIQAIVVEIPDMLRVVLLSLATKYFMGNHTDRMQRCLREANHSYHELCQNITLLAKESWIAWTAQGDAFPLAECKEIMLEVAKECLQVALSDIIRRLFPTVLIGTDDIDSSVAAVRDALQTFNLENYDSIQTGGMSENFGILNEIGRALSHRANESTGQDEFAGIGYSSLVTHRDDLVMEHNHDAHEHDPQHGEQTEDPASGSISGMAHINNTQNPGLAHLNENLSDTGASGTANADLETDHEAVRGQADLEDIRDQIRLVGEDLPRLKELNIDSISSGTE